VALEVESERTAVGECGDLTFEVGRQRRVFVSESAEEFGES
jgi:hypothetical protein